MYRMLIHLQYLTCNQLYQINFRLPFKKSYLIYKIYYISIVCVKHATFVNLVHHKKEHLSETKTRYTSTKYILHKAKFKALDCPSFGVLSFIIYHCLISDNFRLCIIHSFLKIRMYIHFKNALDLSFYYYESMCCRPLENTVIHAYVYFGAYLYGTHILSFYRAERFLYGLALIAIIHDCIGCLFIYNILVYYTHYSFLYEVKYHITHRPVNVQLNSWHFWLLIKRVTLYLLTQIMSNNSLYKLIYLSTLFINCCLCVQLTLDWSDCCTKLEVRFLWIACGGLFLVCGVHAVQGLMSIVAYIMFSFIFSNMATLLSTPMSQATFLLIVFICLFIMNKCRAINRFGLLGCLSVRKIDKENYSSFRKVIEVQYFNYVLNYYILIVVYNITISRPLFSGISELDILYLLHYGCTILYHGKRSYGNEIKRIYMYTCCYRYTVNILCIPLYNTFTLYANLIDKKHVLIRKQYIMINYEIISRIRQVKHNMFFLISQGNTEIENNKSITISMFYNILLYIYIRLHFIFLLHTTVLLIIHVDRCKYSVFIYRYHTIMKQSIYLCEGNTQGGGSYYCVHPWVYQLYRDFG